MPGGCGAGDELAVGRFLAEIGFDGEIAQTGCDFLSRSQLRETIFILFSLIVASIVLLETFRRSASRAIDALADHSPEERRLSAKRTNEAIKLSATCANNLAVGVLIGGFVGPAASGHSPDTAWLIGLLLISTALHLLGRLLLNSLKSED